MQVVDHVGLSPQALDQLSATVARLATLEDVLRWSFALVPPRNLAGLIVQDEYTHDVILAWTEGRYLVFDTT